MGRRQQRAAVEAEAIKGDPAASEDDSDAIVLDSDPDDSPGTRHPHDRLVTDQLVTVQSRM